VKHLAGEEHHKIERVEERVGSDGSEKVISVLVKKGKTK
jgi:hypothetical protein